MRLSLLAVLVPLCLGRVSFLGWSNNGIVGASCQSTVNFPVGLSFAQTCLAACVAPITFSMNPDLTQYGIVLNQTIPASLAINPNPQAVVRGSLNTTIVANDQDGPPTSSLPLTITFDCPLMLGTQIPNQNGTEGQPFAFDVTPFFNNPSRNALTWVLETNPSSNALSISPQGIISGTPTYTEASLVPPLKLTVVATDTVTRRTVRSNTFDFQVAPKSGVSFPSALGQIPAQTATEGVLYQLTAGRYFNNPSNFRVVWSIIGGPLQIDSTTGTISVTPGAAELQATKNQPLSVTVIGTDERGNVARSNSFTFTVQPQSLAAQPVPLPLPPVHCGSTCCPFNLSDFVFNPSSSPAQFTIVSGLPAASQIRVSADGTLSGVTSMADVQASPISLKVTASNGGASIPLNPIVFTVTPMTAPILSTEPIPNRTVKVNTNVRINVSPYFVVPPSTIPTVWTMSSTSPSLKIDSTGTITGILTEQDFLLQPSLTLTVTASNRNSCGGGQISGSFILTIDPNWQGPNCNNGINGIPTTVVTCEGVFLRLNFSKYCYDPKGLPLNFSITGLPNSSGFTLLPSSGLLTGSSTPSASSVGTASISVCASNSVGLQDCTPPFAISFQRPKRPPTVDPPIPSPITAIKGQRFVGYFNFHFYEPDSQPLIYSVAGLPIGSGMGIGPITGIFSGIPNEADYRASPLILSIFASNEQNVVPSVCQSSGAQGGRARADLIIIVETPATPPICRPLPPQTNTAQLGQFWAVDLSPFFLPGDGATKMEFALRSLPRGSGLSIDPTSPVISGVISQQDALSSPLTLVVAATNGYGSCQTSLSLIVGPRVPPPSPISASDPCPLSFQNIFPQNSVQGMPFQLNLNQYITLSRPNMPVSFLSTGFPGGTGFVQNVAGMFSGSPSPSDIAQGSLTIVTTVSCGPFGRPVSKQWQLYVSRGGAGGGGGGGCNACFSNNGNCQQQCIVLDSQNCFPTCGCNPGFALNPDGKTCRPSTGCDQNNGGCSGVCTTPNLGMAPVCSCAQNWILQSDKQTCRYDPCGYNNGGCEQLCTSDGMSPRCDCQTGLLSSDGKTCSRDIIVVGTIPPALVLPCQTFAFDLSTIFSRPGGGQLSFSLSGLPAQTGFRVSSSGLMSGVASSADCAMPQPMTVGITATYGSTSVHAVMFMSAFCGASNACGNSGGGTGGTGSPAPSQTPIPVLAANVCSPFRFDLAPYFTGGLGSVQFSVLGLPQGSGFQISPQGVLSGTPTDCDCAQSPLSLTIVARDSPGRMSKAVVTIRFASCNCLQQQQPNRPSTSTGGGTVIDVHISIPGTTSSSSGSSSSAHKPDPPKVIPYTPATRRIHNVAQCGQPFFVDCAEVFRVNGLHYSVHGLPTSSGLRLSDTGVLSGTPNNADARSSPLNAYVTATDRFGEAQVLQIEVEVQGDCGGLPAPARGTVAYRSGVSIPAQDSNTGILPIQIARRSQLFHLDLSLISFSGLPGKLTYDAEGLPLKSGLSLTKAGLLTGLPSEADCLSLAPVRVTVHVHSLNSSASNNTLYIQFLCDVKPAPLPAINSALPIASGTVGELFYYDVTPYLTTPTTDLSTITFACRGLAAGSNLHISNSGVISGIPSAVDMNGPALLVSATDNSGNVVQSTLRVLIHTPSNNTAPVFVPLDVLKAPSDKLFSLNVGERFYDKDMDTLRIAMDLSPSSGLKFDNRSDVLSGIPSSFDIQQPQPVRLLAFADDGKGANTEGPIFITFSDSSRGTSKASTPAISTGLNRDPVSIGIRRQVATQGVPFIMSIASAFVDQDGDTLAYSVSGFPIGTGLAVDASGVISGTPTEADAAALQPLRLTANVNDGQGGTCNQDFLLTVFHGQKSVNHAPIAQAFADAKAYVDELFLLRASFNFADVDGDMLYYAMAGQPLQSGLSISATSGVLSGTPTSADLAASPLVLTLVVDDGAGAIAQSSLRLTILPARKNGNKKPPLTRQMPRLSATDGAQINFIVSNYFTPANPKGENLRFAVFGLPSQTGLTLNQNTGVFGGIPSASDFAAKQPLVAGFVACDSQQQCTGNVLFIDCFSPTHASSTTSLLPDYVISEKVSPLGVPEIKFQVGTWGFFQTSRFLASVGTNATYEMAGLDANTGLKFDTLSGMLYGTPNINALIAADSCAGRCIPIVISASDGSVQTFVLKFIISAADDVNHAPFARAIAPATIEPGKMVLLDVWTNFVDPDEDSLVFSVLGLPDNSGFSFVASSGVFFGVPSVSDLSAAQPLVLTLIANDQKGGQVQETLMLSVANSSSSVNQVSKTCQQLGWTMTVPNSVLCTRAIKVNGICPSNMSFADAVAACSIVGARLCSSQELSDISARGNGANRDECVLGRVWTSSTCALSSEAIVQVGANGTKQCQSKLGSAMLRCCANSSNPSPPTASVSVAASFSSLPDLPHTSAKSCDELPAFVTSPSALNKAVCSSAFVGAKSTCSGPVSLVKATQLCAQKSARLCTVDELSQDIGNSQECDYGSHRVWSLSECATEGQVYTQAGSSAFLHDVPKNCTSITDLLPVYCCADQKRGAYFQNLQVIPTRNTIKINWTWKAFPSASISYHKGNGISAVSWITPQAGQMIPMAGDVSFTLQGLTANSKYVIRVTPLNAKNRAVPTQVVKFQASTLA